MCIRDSYLGAAHQTEVVDKVFRTAYGSVASVVIFQVQDVLKLDNDARMNTPGTVGGKDVYKRQFLGSPRRFPAMISVSAPRRRRRQSFPCSWASS